MKLKLEIRKLKNNNKLNEEIWNLTEKGQKASLKNLKLFSVAEIFLTP